MCSHRGLTAAYVDEHWPGHAFPELLYLFRAAGLLTYASSLGAVITRDEGLVRKANDLKEFHRLLFNDINDWAVEWPDGSWTCPASQGTQSTGLCESTVAFDDHPCTGSPACLVQLEIRHYEVANPHWEGKLCSSCLVGWRAWAEEEPAAIQVVSVTPIASG